MSLPGQNYEGSGFSALFDLTFTRFVTLGVIKMLYLLGLLVIGLIWLLMLIAALREGVGALLGALVLGTLVALFYIVLYRVWLEVIVVLFRIGENTSKLVEQRRGDTLPG